MTRISDEKKARIIELWLAGLPRDPIARKLKVSGETASRHIAQFKRSLTEKAAELLDGLRLLSMELRDTRKTLPEALSIAQLHSKLEKIGVNAENIEHFIVASKKITKEMGIEAKDYVRAAIKLEKLEAQTGKNYNEITRDFEDKANKIDQLKEQITQLDEKKDESKKELQNELRENKLTRKDLAYASTLRDALTPHGFSLKDAAKIPKLIRHIQACKQDPKKVLDKLERIDNLENAMNTLNGQTKTKQQELNTIINKTIETRQQHSQLLLKIRSFQELNTITNKIEETKQQRSQLLLEIRSLQGQEKELATKIAEHSQTTLPILEGEKKRLSNEIDIMEKEIEIAECLSTALLTKKPTNIDTLHYYVSILKETKDDPKADLAQYRKIYEPKIRELLKDTFLDVFGLELVKREKYIELQKLLETGFRNTTTENRTLRTENEKIKKENDKLKTDNETLTKENTELNKKLETLTKNMEKYIEKTMFDPHIVPKKKRTPFEVY